MNKRLKPTTLKLQNYGGGEVAIVCEVEITLGKAGFTTNATVQVQAGTLIDLLLGTDVQP